jgi:hypothetical protein
MKIRNKNRKYTEMSFDLLIFNISPSRYSGEPKRFVIYSLY